MPAQPASSAAKAALRRMFGELPWPCYFCSKMIHEKPFIHHIDGNHSNDAEENVAAAHALCHNRHHKPWTYVTKEGRDRLSVAALKNKPWLLSTGMTGKNHSEETRRMISESKKGQHKGWTWRLVDGKRVWIES